MTFALHESQQGWEIHNERDECVFLGTMDECRDWLDLQEARQQKTLWQIVVQWFRSKPIPEPKPIPASKHSTAHG